MENGYQDHELITASLILISVISFILVSTFNALSESLAAGRGGIFRYRVSQVSDKYELFITPAHFTFAIWGIIYLFLAVSLIIFASSIFMNNEDGKYARLLK